MISEEPAVWSKEVSGLVPALHYSLYFSLRCATCVNTEPWVSVSLPVKPQCLILVYRAN